MKQLQRRTYYNIEADMEQNLSTWAADLQRTHNCAGKILACLFGKALSLYKALDGYEQAKEVVGTGKQSVMLLLQENCQAQLWHTDPDQSQFTRSIIGMFEPAKRVQNLYVYAKDAIAVPTEVKTVCSGKDETPWDALETLNIGTGQGPFTEVYFNNWNPHRGPEVHLPEGGMRAILLHTSDQGQADTPQGQQFWELSAIDTLLTKLEEENPGCCASDHVLQYLQNRDGESLVSESVNKFLEMMRSKKAFSRIDFWHRMRRLNPLADAVADAVVVSPSVPFSQSLSVSFSPSLALSLSPSSSLPPPFASFRTPTYLHHAGPSLPMHGGSSPNNIDHASGVYGYLYLFEQGGAEERHTQLRQPRYDLRVL